MTGSSWLRPAHPLLVAHRGDRAHAPEQTLPAFERAIALGAEMIEADAALTRDGRLVLMHDDTVDRTTDGRGRVADLDWHELSRLDAGAWFDPAFAGCRVPLAAELIDLARAAGIGLCLEAKGEDPATAAAIACALADLVRESDALGWAFVSSFDHAALRAARARVPGLLIAPERLPERGALPVATVVRQALDLATPVLQHRWELLDRPLVDALHDAGIAVWAWNTNDAPSAAATVALGVDGIIGDDVGILAGSRAALPGAPA